jgi:hypothetical protein
VLGPRKRALTPTWTAEAAGLRGSREPKYHVQPYRGTGKQDSVNPRIAKCHVQPYRGTGKQDSESAHRQRPGAIQSTRRAKGTGTGWFALHNAAAVHGRPPGHTSTFFYFARPHHLCGLVGPYRGRLAVSRGPWSLVWISCVPRVRSGA